MNTACACVCLPLSPLRLDAPWSANTELIHKKKPSDAHMEQTKHVQVHGYIINSYSVDESMKNSWPLVDGNCSGWLKNRKQSLTRPDLLTTGEWATTITCSLCSGCEGLRLIQLGRKLWRQAFKRGALSSYGRNNCLPRLMWSFWLICVVSHWEAFLLISKNEFSGQNFKAASYCSTTKLQLPNWGFN